MEALDYESISVSLLLAKQVDNIFPNVRELLKILALLPMGSMEVDEVVFSYSEDSYVYLASQHNDHRMILRFDPHRHACKYRVSNTTDSKARFCSFATKISDKSLACDTTKNKNLLILQYAYSFWLTDDCFGAVFVSRSLFNELDICVFAISLVPITMIILNSFFIEAWMLNSLPNQQGDFSLFETSRL